MKKQFTFLLIILGIFVIANKSEAKINSYDYDTFNDKITLHVDGFIPVGQNCDPKYSVTSTNNVIPIYNSNDPNVIVKNIHVFGGADISGTTKSDWNVVVGCSDSTILIRTLYFGNLGIWVGLTKSEPFTIKIGSPTMSVVDEVTVCISDIWSCNEWPVCSADGTQKRTCNKTFECPAVDTPSPNITQSCTYVPPICTSWQYSNWSQCLANGQQTRSVTSSSPSGCIDGKPILNQSCNYIPICTVNNWSCEDWGACSANGTKARVCKKNTNCEGGASSPAISQSCLYMPPVPACTASDWSCVDWGACTSNNTQKRTCSKILNCQSGIQSPATTQFCVYTPPVPACTASDWSCVDWGDCSSSGKQNRACSKVSKCEGGVMSPATTQSCEYTPSCQRDIWECDSWDQCSPVGTQTRSCRKTYDCSLVEDAAPTTSKFCEATTKPKNDTEGSIDREKIIRSTVKLVCQDAQRQGWQGSGTVIDQYGTILTNRHVAEDAVGACKVSFVTSEDDIPSFVEMADVKKISTDPTENGDMAILKIRNKNNKKFTAVDISQGSSDNLRSGDTILPFGYPNKDLFGETITFTEGPYAGKGTTIKVCGMTYPENVSSFFKTTATVDHGNSGGGAYQKKYGYFMGIPTLGTSCDPNIPSRVNYILSINSIKKWLNSLGGSYSPAKNNFSTLKNYYSQSANVQDINLATIKIADSSDGADSLDKANTKEKTLASTVASLGVHKSPSVKAKVVWSIKKGKSYSIIGAQGDWYQIKISNKLSGWVMKKYVKTKK